MKKALIVFLAVFLSLSACGKSASQETDDLPMKETGPPAAQTAPKTYKTMEEFEEEEGKTGTGLVYYVPDLPAEQYRLKEITKRDGVYVMLEYSVLLPQAEDKTLGDYDSERLGTLICRTSLFENGEKALKDTFIDNGYIAFTWNGNTFYRWDEHAENKPSERIVGYEIAFLQNGMLVFMHLPAVRPFEEMMEYTALAERVIP